MNKKNFSDFLSKINSLTKEQKAHVISVLDVSQDNQPNAADIIDKEFSQKPVCPSCSSENVHKYGIVNNLQRYRCKQCKRTFNALSGTSMSRLRKKEVWMDYSKALADSLSLTKAAQLCGIDRTTAFRWRHRFLQLSEFQTIKCSGITEIDETYFRESFKGKKVVHRKPRKRGKLEARGLSSELITVIIAKDRTGHVCDGVLKSRTAKEVGLCIGPHMSHDTLLCMDRSRILLKFAKDAGVPFETINRKQRRGREKVFHIQAVNAYHSRLKNWMARFNGVATEKLPNYLQWRRLHELQLPSPQDWLTTMIKGEIHTKRN